MRRVHTLHLTAPSDTLVRRGTLLLEDALHTASLPEADGGRLFVVRSLYVGNIQTHQSPATLALAIEQRLRELRSIAIHAEDPSAEHQAVIYFRDEAEAYQSLAMRVVRGDHTDAWFWSRAVREWEANLPRGEALRRLLFGITQTRSGVGALVALVNQLREHYLLNRLLEGLTESDGTALLQVCGWSRPDSTIIIPTQTYLSEMQPIAWMVPLQNWLARWSASDARLLWLSTIALVAEQPARLLDAGLVARSQQLIRQLASIHLNATVEPPLPNRKPPSAHSPSPLHKQEREVNAPDIYGEFSEEFLQRSDRNQTTRSTDQSPQQQIPNITFSPSPSDLPTQTAPDSKNTHPSTALCADFKELPPQALPLLDTPQLTPYAGLFFLLPLLSYLGMGEFLQAHPHLIDLDLPHRLLHQIGQRLGILADDPVRLVLQQPDPNLEIEFCKFIVPQRWQEGICDTKGWILQQGRTPSRILLDRTGRLAVALWRGKRDELLRSFIENRSLTRQTRQIRDSEPTNSDLTVLQQAWLTAIRRWCRRYAQMGLCDLVCRPGSITATPTHIDISFDHHQADIRIRRVGLDIDPGWLPWFGRVVLFHYQYRN